MALHPEVMDKAHEGLDRVVGMTRLPTWDDERSLPFVRALIKEVHRWGPSGSLVIPHAVTQDDGYDGQLIPKGTIVFPKLTALSRSKKQYSDPDVFDSNRFRGDLFDASASALAPDYLKRDHFHYGFGRRLCQGIFVAEASLYIDIVRVLWGFNIKGKPGHELNMDAKIVTKPKSFSVAIESRGPSYTALIRDAPTRSHTNVLDIDDVPTG
ncbi:MAG: hypothetical protein L6R42_005388 [Xanthoria sp. 1 TBL-2021]|nr:MAG: hypothetical protein L6R42_005388 [Xanthoria sp. 1 TBL-2021]